MFLQYQSFVQISCVASVFAMDWCVLLITVTHCQTARTLSTFQSIRTTSRFQFQERNNKYAPLPK